MTLAFLFTDTAFPTRNILQWYFAMGVSTTGYFSTFIVEF